MTTTDNAVADFFTEYKEALLARDARAVARMYAVPGLIVFPGNSLVVSDARQTEEFFANSWSQYEGIDEIDETIRILAQAPAGVWADVTWAYGGTSRERFCYQLIPRDSGFQIAVLTPMAVDD